MRTPLAALPLVLSACVTTSASGPGVMDPTAFASATAASARKMEIDADGTGHFTKVSVEHVDAALAPAALQAMVQSTWPGATLQKYEREVYADVGMVHEVEVKTADARECELSMTDAGALYYTECKVAQAEMAPGVAATMSSTLPGGTLVEAEVRKGPKFDECRIEATAGGRTYYLRIGSDGKLISKAAVLQAEVNVPVP